jgi:hypothetical protein
MWFSLRVGAAGGEQLEPVGSQLACRGDVPVEGLAGDPDFSAELADVGVGLAHGGGREAQLGWVIL